MLDVFKIAEAPFVSVNGVEFSVGKYRTETLEIYIQELIPVRKLFINSRIICWSIGGKRAKNGTYCLLCSDNFRCKQRIRIKMTIANLEAEPFPALLEINKNSFQSLQEAVEIIGENRLPDKPVLVKNDINKKGGIFFTFTPGI